MIRRANGALRAYQLIEDDQEPVQYHYIGAQLHQGVMQASLEIALAGHMLGGTPRVPTVGGRHAEQEVVQGLALHLQVCRIEPLLPGTIGETVVLDFSLVARQLRVVVVDHAHELVGIAQRSLVQRLHQGLQYRLHVPLFALVRHVLAGLVGRGVSQGPDIGQFPFRHFIIPRSGSSARGRQRHVESKRASTCDGRARHLFLICNERHRLQFTWKNLRPAERR